MQQALKAFLEREIKKGESVALALSGGPDSRALFDLLLPFRGTHFSELHILHVDHGWREESSLEAKEIEGWARERRLPFHLKRVKELSKKNREEVARKERLTFFQEIAKKEKFSAVFLAHHQEDLLETGMRRLFVGGRWELVPSMRAIQQMGELKLMRPLLAFTKRELEQQVRGPFFIDRTNSDASVSERVRMRLQLLPELKRTFGKEIEAPTLNLIQDLAEIEEWMTLLIGEIDQTALSGPFGTLWRPVASLPLLRFWLRRRFNLSRCEEEGVIRALKEGRGLSHFGSLTVYRGLVFLVAVQSGSWRFEEGEPSSGFDALFQGNSSAPFGEILPLDALSPKERRIIKEKRTKSHFPSVLWSAVPVIRKPTGELFDPAVSRGEKSSCKLNYRVDVETVV